MNGIHVNNRFLKMRMVWAILRGRTVVHKVNIASGHIESLTGDGIFHGVLIKGRPARTSDFRPS